MHAHEVPHTRNSTRMRFHSHEVPHAWSSTDIESHRGSTSELFWAHVLAICFRKQAAEFHPSFSRSMCVRPHCCNAIGNVDAEASTLKQKHRFCIAFNLGREDQFCAFVFCSPRPRPVAKEWRPSSCVSVSEPPSLWPPAEPPFFHAGVLVVIVPVVKVVVVGSFSPSSSCF